MEKFLKDSDVLSRRTLLSSGALVGLGALLAACGQQANNEAASHRIHRTERDHFSHRR